ITVTAPNGGESWAVGSTQTITWTTTDISSGKFRIFLLDGTTSLGTIATQLPITQNSFSWTVGHLIDAPDVGAGTNYKVKVRIISDFPNDSSDAPFSITSSAPPTGSITVTSPNGGESWAQGSSHNITWSSSGITSGTYRITLLKGGVPAGIVASGLPSSQHSYNWNVGTTDSPFQGAAANYRIQVEHQGGTALDFSDGAFVITVAEESPAGTITVTSPNGGSWEKDSTKTITWEAPGIASGTYQITLRKGGSSLGVVTTGIPASIDNYSWKVGELQGIHSEVTPGSGYTIRVQLLGESTYGDSAPFAIVIRFFPPWLDKLKQMERLRIPWWIDPPGPDPDPWEGINLPFDKLKGLVNETKVPVNVGLVQNGKLLGILGQFKGSRFIPGNMAKLIGENGLRFKLGRGQLAEFSKGGNFVLRFVNAKTGEVMYNLNVQMQKQMMQRGFQKIRH
ncbi:MAG TPA: hypothetical protein ENN40_03105, partial [Candidatus Aminicenantes bacterium]|nr:hypothetical protein [Candidatus Aminicenantes bacterium]